LLISNFSIINFKIRILFIFLISIFTRILSGLNSLVEKDIKKIIALSTLNQLRVIFITVSLGLVILRYFHLISHAIFKSLLFLNGGVIIHF
jgi:NADH:ubiquinone oxidoreductase subunit 5 (subunit L)/multisubunit Na+/H+ antiporter MnhA subunit